MSGKARPSELAQVLRHVTADHPNLLVGAETGDDAAVWRVTDDRALVATVDFITPIVDDARIWGRVAAVNSVSDVTPWGAAAVRAQPRLLELRRASRAVARRAARRRG